MESDMESQGIFDHRLATVSRGLWKGGANGAAGGHDTQLFDNGGGVRHAACDQLWSDEFDSRIDRSVDDWVICRF